MARYTRIDNSLLDDPLATDLATYGAYMQLLQMAYYVDRVVMIRGHRVTVKRGQCYASVRYLSQVWCCSVNTVRRILNRLGEQGRVRQVADCVIEVVNYNVLVGVSDDVSDGVSGSVSDGVSSSVSDSVSKIDTNNIITLQYNNNANANAARVVTEADAVAKILESDTPPAWLAHAEWWEPLRLWAQRCVQYNRPFSGWRADGKDNKSLGRTLAGLQAAAEDIARAADGNVAAGIAAVQYSMRRGWWSIYPAKGEPGKQAAAESAVMDFAAAAAKYN